MDFRHPVAGQPHGLYHFKGNGEVIKAKKGYEHTLYVGLPCNIWALIIRFIVFWNLDGGKFQLMIMFYLYH